jgi:serine/threonine protein kinase
MQRVLEAVSTGAETCVSCSTPLTDDRCGHCGAAARAGPYRVLEVIARSQHGAMYLAEDDAGAKVALKELVFSLVPTTQELEAFTREAELLEALDHPRIPKFLKSFTVGQGVSTRLYLAQQYLTGHSLTERLTEEHFDEEGVLRLARQALQILAYLHGRSPVVVHRDVKPDNFIIGADGSLSLVDFGAARSVKAAGTHGATLVGTFGYMAPEQLGGSVDARSDLYGLGATLVHLLTRTPPERMLSPGMSLDFQKHVNVSVKTERFLSRLVATRPNQRFVSAEDALAYLDGRSTSEAHSTSSRTGRILGAVTVALFAGALVTALSSRQVDDTAVVVAPPKAPAKEVVKLPDELPPSGEVRFPWQHGQWRFDKPGYWVMDESGRGHHALLPTTGFKNEFHGLVWDGTTNLSVADSSDFALRGPFTISVDFTLGPGPHAKPMTLISRGDPEGKFSWLVQLVPHERGTLIRFSIANESGEVSSLTTPLLQDNRSMFYAEFDPVNGRQSIVQSCETASTITTVRPARELPEGSRLQMVKGFRGTVSSLGISTGLMQPSSPAKPCGYSGVRLEEE